MASFANLIDKFNVYKDKQTELLINNMDTRSPDIRVITIDYVGKYFAKGHSTQYNPDLGEISIPATLLFADLASKNSNRSTKIIVKKDYDGI